MLRRALVTVVAAVCATGVIACGGDDDAATTSRPVTSAEPVQTSTAATEAIGAAVTRDLVYATGTNRTLTLDVHASTDPARGPMVIHFPGADGATPAWLPEDLVAQGATVFVVDYSRNSSPESLTQDLGTGFALQAESAACAIHFARAQASEFGNDDPVVVLTGFSLGGGVAAHAALFGASLEAAWDQYAAARGGPPSQLDCEVTDGSTQIDALVAIAGPYDLYVPTFEGKYGSGWMRDRDPELQTFLAGAIEQNPDLKVRLLHGEDDGTIPYSNSVDFAAALVDAGHDVLLIPFAGGHGAPPELTIQTVDAVSGS